MRFLSMWGGERANKRNEGGEVVLRITGVQKTEKEKAKILPVDGADT